MGLSRRLTRRKRTVMKRMCQYSYEESQKLTGSALYDKMWVKHMIQLKFKSNPPIVDFSI